MPLDENILGFSNRWYEVAMKAPVLTRISTDLEILVVTAPFFIATKLEAFKGRGKGDFLASHDLEDLIAVVDGRETLAAEVNAEREDLRQYLGREVKGLLASPGFVDALPCYLLADAASQSRITIVRQRLDLVAGI